MRLNKKIHLVTKENDIKYRAPLSYRHFRIIGWIMMACAQAAIVCGACLTMWAKTEHNLDAISTANEVFDFLGQIAIPLFLLANFALILNSRQNIKKLLLTHIGCAVGIYVGFLLVYERYLCGLAMKIDPETGKSTIDFLVSEFFARNLNFNVFIDLLMCSLLYFFICYNPTKYFQGKKIYIFRAFVALPILYEIVSTVLKGLSLGECLFTIPVEIIPLLTSKPTFTFLAFIVITIFMKRREHLFIRRGGTMKEYEEFLQTNTNALHFSIFIAIVFAIASILDSIAYFGLSAIFIANNPELAFDSIKDFKALFNYTNAWGIGKATSLMLAAPLVLLFRYTKTHSDKTKFLDIVIPLAGLGLCALTYIEGFYEIIVFR